MKFRKLILPAILALGAIGGFAAAKAHQSQFQRASAMSAYTGDPDLDVGINIQHGAAAAADFDHICTFYVDGLKSGDVSQGDYLAFRMKSNNHGASYFDVFPNVNGNAFRVPISSAVSGIKCVPAVPNGEAWAYNGGRTWDLPMNFCDDWDLWFCIPKTSFSRKHFGPAEAINWNEGLWCVYFMFYGTTIDNINFDLGDIWTANIDENNHLVKINQICDWSSESGNNISVVENSDRIKISHNFSEESNTLKPAVRFIRAIQNVDTCDKDACDAAYAANSAAFNALTAAQEDYLYDAVIGDYADGDTAHAGGQYTAYKAIDKWNAICEVAGATPSQKIVLFNDNKMWVIITIASATAMISLAGLFFALRRRRVAK